MPKILAIDDNPDNLVVITALLKNLMPECALTTAQSGPDEIEKALMELPDTVLLDISMPGMDGFETCRRLKADERTLCETVMTDQQQNSRQMPAVTAALWNFGGDKIIRIAIYLICIVLMISIAPAAAQKTIIVGGEIDYPPYCFLDENGRPTGFQVDLTRSIARVMGMEIEINLSNWADARQRLENGTIDIICGMFYSDERAEIYDFSPPYTIVSSVIFARRDAPFVQSIDDLRNKEIIVMRGEAMHDLVVQQKITQKLILAETPDDVLRRLAAGEGDYALGAQMPGLYWTDKLGLSNITTMGKPLEPFKDCFAVRKGNGNTLLLSRFTEGLMILQQTGEYQKLYQKWFDVLEMGGVSLRKALQYAAAVFLPLLVLLVTGFIWSWTLRRTVASRTRELSESRQQIQTLSDNLPNGYVYQILMDGEQRRFTYISAGVEHLHGVSARDVLADPMLFYGQFIGKDRHLIAEQEALTQDRLARFHVEVRYRRPSGEIRVMLITASPRRLPDQTIATDGLAIDITERKQAEQQLRESEQKYRFMTEQMNDVVWTSDLEMRVTYISPSDERILGFTPEERAKHTLVEMLTPSSQEKAMEAISKEYALEETGQADFSRSVTVELEYRHKDGSTRWLETIAKGIRDDKGLLIGFHGVSRDITKRKQIEEVLKESEERFSFAMDAGRDGVYDWDLETRDIYYSPGWKRMLGYEPDELPDDFSVWEKLTRPEDVEKSWQMMKELIEGKRDRFELEFEMQHKDGHWIYILSRSKIYKDANGKPARVVGTHVDITEREEQKERLRLSESRYRKAQELGKVGNWEYNLKTAEFWGSDESKKIYGFDPDKDTFSTEEVESCIIERERVHQALVDLIENGKPYNLEFDIITKDTGKIKPVVSIAEIEKDGAKNPVKISGVVHDITDRKQAEAERENLQTQLLQAQKMESVGRLAGGVAHDFNNMLSVIIGHTEMALEKINPGDPLHEDLTESITAAKRSADLTRQLLAFARKQMVTPRVIDLNETVEGMLKMLRRLIGEDIDLLWKPGRNLGPVRIDPSQIDQLLANLCVNARDAIKGVGKITIETDAAAFDDAYCTEHAGFTSGEFLLLVVSDNGCGMDPETIGHLFEPFFTTKELGKGTGLGLASVYGAVKQNNGFINVYSEPGQGTTFKVYLPRHTAKSMVPLPEQAAGRPLERGHEIILLVEDEPAILKMTTKMLERLGYTVIGAATPGEAIRLARENTGRIDLLMTDVVMPEMNGRDLAENILSIYPGIKRLFMSGYTANVIAHHGVLDAGVHFIQKPFSRKDLAARVREAIGAGETGGKS
jgi:PAS domain S-box-containing protein